MPYPITETVRAYLRADRAWPYVGKPPKVNCKTWPVATGLTLTTHQASRQPSSGKCVLYSMHVGARHGSQAGSQATALTGGVRRFGWVHDGSCRWFLPRALIGSFLPPRQGLRRESCSPTRRRGCPVRHHTTVRRPTPRRYSRCRFRRDPHAITVQGHLLLPVPGGAPSAPRNLFSIPFMRRRATVPGGTVPVAVASSTG